jgi:hypothetical protein
MNWYFENALELAGLFIACFLLAKAFEKVFNADLSYDLKKSKT